MRVPNQILVIGLSNIGDAILTSPVIQRLHEAYPEARLTLVVSERARPLFAQDPRIHHVVEMDEFSGWLGRLRLVGWLWTARPDLVVDLRHTILPLIWRPWRALRYLLPPPRRIGHMRDRHLWKLARQAPGLSTVRLRTAGGADGRAMWISPHDVAAATQLLQRSGLRGGERLVLISPGAKSHIKRWYADRFAALADRLIDEAHTEIIFTGEPDESPIVTEILEMMRHRAHTAVGKTTIRQLAALMQRASLVITNDSASLHLACTVNVPVLALFGPTDPRKYGPTGERDRVIQRKLFCVPCERALCRFNHECMRFISVEEVYEAARQMLESDRWKVKGGRVKAKSQTARKR